MTSENSIVATITRVHKGNVVLRMTIEHINQTPASAQFIQGTYLHALKEQQDMGDKSTELDKALKQYNM